MCKKCIDEYLIPIDTKHVLKLLEIQSQQTDAMYELVQLIYEKQRDWDEEYKKPKPKLTITPK